MASVSVTQNFNVTVQQISGITATTNAQSSAMLTANDVTGTAVGSSATLTVQIGIESDGVGANTITITVTDPHSNQSFVGQVQINFADQDSSTVFVQFSSFPLQADQVTPMDECNYTIHLTGSSASFQVFTV